MLKRSIQKFVITILVNFMLVGSIVSNAMAVQMEGRVLTFAEEFEASLEDWHTLFGAVPITSDDLFYIVNELGEYFAGYENDNFKTTSDISDAFLMSGFSYYIYPRGQTFYIVRAEDGYRVPFTTESGHIETKLIMPPLGESETSTETPIETEIETNTDTEVETNTDTEIETDTELESETKINTEADSETEIKSELETKLESESNTEKTSQTSSNSSVPKTGDTTTIGYLLGMLISSFGVVLFMNKRIKNKVNQK